MKMKLTLIATAGILAAAVALGANGCGSTCGPSNCSGCCDANNQCQAGNAATDCGKGGAACGTCTLGQQCVVGTCAFPGGGNGGNGGGSTGNTSSGNTTGTSSGNTTGTSSGNTTGTSSGNTTGSSGGTFSCSSNGPCANDPAPTSQSIASCTTIQNGVCGTELDAYGQCALDHPSCDSNGMSTSPNPNCASQSSAFLSCCQANPSACGAATTTGTTGTSSGTTTGTTGTSSGTTTGTSSGTTGGSYCTALPSSSVSNGDMGTVCSNPDGGVFQGTCGSGEYCFDAFREGTARCIAVCSNYFQPCATGGGLCFPYSNGPDAGYTGLCGHTCASDTDCSAALSTGYQCYPLVPNGEAGDCVYTGGGGTLRCTSDASCGTSGLKCDTTSGACYEPCTGGTACTQGGCCAHTTSFDYCDIEQ